MLQKLMCVQGCIKLVTGGQQHEAVKAGVEVLARTPVYFHSQIKGFVSLCLCAILNGQVQFQIHWATHRGEKSLHVAAVHIP